MDHIRCGFATVPGWLLLVKIVVRSFDLYVIRGLFDDEFLFTFELFLLSYEISNICVAIVMRIDDFRVA